MSKPEKTLLHTCCAPCLTQCLAVLSGRDKWENALSRPGNFEISVFYDNPNIYPESEYHKRKDEVRKFLNEVSGVMPAGWTEDNTEERRAEWDKGARPMKDEPEKGKRCVYCYAFRLEETFRAAKEKGFAVVATTLTLSPLKNTKEINRIGRELSVKYGVEYLETDFKKNDGFRKSIALCERYGIYRQNYCGCVYSLNGRAGISTSND